MIADLLALVAANACFLAAGAGILRALGRWSLPLAYTTGLATVGALAPLLLLAGLSLEVWHVVALCAALAALALVRRPVRAEPARGRPPRIVFWPSAVVLFGMLALLAVDLVFQPLAVWDAWAQWTAKAKALVVFDGLPVEVFGSDAYRLWNPDYPLLLPAVEAIDFRFMRGFNTQVIHVQFWLVLAGFVGSLHALLRARVDPSVLWPVLAMVVLAPGVQIITGSALADVPLAAFFALAGVLAWRWLADGGLPELALLTVFATAALATKMEARFYVAALYLAVILLALRQARRDAVLAGTSAAAAVLVAVIPWSGWVARHDVTGAVTTENAFDVGFLADHLDRIPLAVGTLGRELLDPTSWLLIVPIAAAAAVIGFRSGRREAVWLLAGTALVAAAALTWIYWWTPLEPEWHLRQSARRVLTALVLFAAALTPVLVSESGAERRGTRRAPTG